MEKRTPGFVIGAVKSGSGKTVLTCALLEAFKQRGLDPHAFKCGPDYIDPMFHRKVIEIPSHNLDGFFSDGDQLRRLYAKHAGDGIAVVEGVMGLYDGLGGIRQEGSAYELACTLELPIVLVVDVHGMGRSLLPLLEGFLLHDREKRIAGVILNRTTQSFAQTLRSLIEEELRIPVLGWLPKRQELSLESRHLGLKLPHELEGLKEQLRGAAKILEETVSVDAILSLAGAGEEDGERDSEKGRSGQASRMTGKPSGLKIGVAQDAAFCFYYEENFRLLEELGAQLVTFSPLEDGQLPEGICGLLLGGGYPELYGERLAGNHSMRRSIQEALRSGMPCLAECGGFLYLHDSLVDQEGVRHAMCGVVKGAGYYAGKLVRFGYVTLRGKNSRYLPEGEIIRGHEFHYYESENNGSDCVARKPVTQRNWDCVHEQGDGFWGFPHLYYPSNPRFVERFLAKAGNYRRRMEEESALRGKEER